MQSQSNEPNNSDHHESSLIFATRVMRCLLLSLNFTHHVITVQIYDHNYIGIRIFIFGHPPASFYSPQLHSGLPPSIQPLMSLLQYLKGVGTHITRLFADLVNDKRKGPPACNATQVGCVWFMLLLNWHDKVGGVILFVILRPHPELRFLYGLQNTALFSGC